MRIENTFTVPVAVDEAWAVLLDVERVAPCMPGATLESVDGDVFTGRVKAKVGPVTLTYKGRAEFTSRDAATRTATLTAKGKDARGAGTAAAAVTVRLAGENGITRVQVHTDLDITGKPAQLGRGVITDVGNKIIGQFADALAEQLTAERPVADPRAAAAAQTTASPAGAGGGRHARPVDDSIDVLGLAGQSLLKRLLAALTRPFRRRRPAQERSTS
ncbi:MULTISPECIES: SRPBCC family protein [Actinomadura]|uniref:Carbon monoxide dehydrogenase n=1 Tax=Actinomadura geliboluensis TaxID=882440 RepID=A0A5S4HKH1_9ACTN|nr:SRPBCC family protein [Actinomadura geliboluensis]TMR42370.1 carbon monoxide dehydrogenase [Actinomadura geliboluensis]